MLSCLSGKNPTLIPLSLSSQRTIGKLDILSPVSRGIRAKSLIPRAKLQNEQLQDLSKYVILENYDLKNQEANIVQKSINEIKEQIKIHSRPKINREMLLENRNCQGKAKPKVVLDKEKLLQDKYNLNAALPNNVSQINSIDEAIDKITKVGYDVNNIKIRMTDAAQKEIFSSHGTAYGLTFPFADTVYLRKYTEGNKELSAEQCGKAVKHEIGHVLHRRNDEDLFVYLRNCSFTKDTAKEAATVSSYAASNPCEFVAETFRAIVDKMDLSDKVMGIYKKFGGALPKPK